MRRALNSISVIILLLAAGISGAQDGAVSAQDSEVIPFLLTYPNLDNPDRARCPRRWLVRSASDHLVR